MSGVQKVEQVDQDFLKRVLLVLAAASALVYYPVMQYASDHVTEGVVAGVVLSAVNVVFGVVIVRYAVRSTHAVFMQIALGGIVARLFVMLGLLLFCILVMKIDAVPLIGSLFVMSMIFLAMEVLYINKKIQQ